jgi:ATP-dependent Lhr-like helicase
VRATPITLVGRDHLEAWREAPAPGSEPLSLSPDARRALEHLTRAGASFFNEIVRGTGLLRTQVEAALAELVAHGLATADSFTGLRALLTPSAERPPLGGRRRRGRVAVFGMESAGRWTRLRTVDAAPVDVESPADPLETIARALLRRYGVVFRRLLARESTLPPWRDLLRVYRRLEARGEIRGGRFVAGFSGEQYALAEAVGLLRAVRREPGRGELVAVSGADPLNLIGLVTPGERLPVLAGNRLLFRDGIPVAVRAAREVRFLVDLPPADREAAAAALVRRRVSPRLRAYLGRSA